MDRKSLADVKVPEKLDNPLNINDLTNVPESNYPLVGKGRIPSPEKDGKNEAMDTKEKEKDISFVPNSQASSIGELQDLPLSQESNTNLVKGVSPTTMNKILERVLATTLGHLS